jgi:hypothetical protein
VSYAQNTTVSVEKSRAEIERILQRYGCDAFMYGWNDKGAAIQFRAHGRHIKFELPLPDKTDRRFTQHSRGYRTADAALEEWEQACRQRWRALALVVKAKLEAVEAQITLFEDEFMAHIVLPSGETVGEWMRPQIDEAYVSGAMPTKMQLALPSGPSE